MPLQAGVMRGSILDVDGQVIVNAASSYGFMGMARQGSSGGRQEKDTRNRSHFAARGGNLVHVVSFVRWFDETRAHE